ncbi:protein of unknown function [Methylorubrum extorquens]|uniref:Uncharacterized protein n=1 Tax=Methylorubrum extorquens TaxID=408 RepID=A0A2N9ASN5_METEX|nr:protein of unknown function [Methylorubrum extorquens]
MSRLLAGAGEGPGAPLPTLI